MRWDKVELVKEKIVSGKVTFLGGSVCVGIYHVDYLTSADQEIPE